MENGGSFAFREDIMSRRAFRGQFLVSAVSALVALLALVPAAQAVPVIFTAPLDGASEAPSNASPGSGSVTVTFDLAAHTMRVEVSFAGLIGTTSAAHIHCCVAAPGTVGVATVVPSFTGFPFGVTSGVYDHTYDTTLAASFSGAFVTAHGGTAAGAEAALFAGLDAGLAYFNLHTTVFPGGEIRGFLTPVDEPAALGLFVIALAGLGLAGLGASRRRTR